MGRPRAVAQSSGLRSTAAAPSVSGVELAASACPGQTLSKAGFIVAIFSREVSARTLLSLSTPATGHDQVVVEALVIGCWRRLVALRSASWSWSRARCSLARHQFAAGPSRGRCGAPPGSDSAREVSSPRLEALEGRRRDSSRLCSWHLLRSATGAGICLAEDDRARRHVVSVPARVPLSISPVPILRAERPGAACRLVLQAIWSCWCRGCVATSTASSAASRNQVEVSGWWLSSGAGQSPSPIHLALEVELVDEAAERRTKHAQGSSPPHSPCRRGVKGMRAEPTIATLRVQPALHVLACFHRAAEEWSNT